MARVTIRPATTVREAIRHIEEVPAAGSQPGIVRVMVGVVDELGEFVVPQQFTTHSIEGRNYLDLVGPPAAWAPDKPDGTYRNDDLWHCIDVAKAEVADRVARVKEAQAQQAAAQAAREEQARLDAEAAALAAAQPAPVDPAPLDPVPAEGVVNG
jgi:hypothetical protein